MADVAPPDRTTAAPASTIVYDLCVAHAAADARSAIWVCRTLRSMGLRIRTAERNDSPNAEVAPANDDASDSRLAVSFLGPKSDPHVSVSTPFGDLPWITMLGPGCRIGPGAVAEPGATVVDLRDGFATRGQMRRLGQAITRAAEKGDPNADPRRQLGPEALKGETIDSYNRFAEQYAEQWCPRPPAALLERFLTLLPSKSVVLDAGCGPGHHASYLADQGHDVIGVDLSPRMLGIARGGEIAESPSFAGMPSTSPSRPGRSTPYGLPPCRCMCPAKTSCISSVISIDS